MKNRKGIIVTLILFALFVWGAEGNSLEKMTHEAINWDIARRMIGEFSLDSYLIE